MEKQPLREWRFTCTAEEWNRLLRRGEVRKAGKVRIGVELGLLLLLAVYCLIAFFADGMSDWRSLGIAVVAVALAVILLVVPEIRFRQEAEGLAQQGKERVVRLYEDGLAFGDSEEIVPFAQCGARLFEDMAVLRFQGSVLFGIPRRALPPEDWERLCLQLSGEEGSPAGTREETREETGAPEESLQGAREEGSQEEPKEKGEPQ